MPDPQSEFLNDPLFRAGAVEGLQRAGINAEPALAFFDQLRAGVLASLDKAPPDPGMPASIFVAAKHPRALREKLGTTDRLVRFEGKVPTDWSGRLVVISESMVGWSRPMPEGDEAVFDLLEREGLGAAPLAIVDPGQRMMLCFPQGAHDENPLRIALPKNARAVTLKDLIEVIDEVRREALLTPQVCPPGLWADREAHAPGEEVERHIQWGVALALRSSFRPVLADIEKITAVGRVDISLLNPEPAPGAPLHPAVVELKALRTCSSNKKPVAKRANLLATLSGHRQAAAYRKKTGAALGLLACFDLRKDKDDILANPVIVAAQAKYFDANLEAKIFKIYANPKDAQEELAAA